MIKLELLEAVAASGREMWAKKLTWGSDAGDSSIRDPETGYIYILPKPSPDYPIPNWGVASADHVAVVDIDGNPVEGSSVTPTVELLTHLRVYQHRPDANAIVHSHGEWSTVFAGLRRGIPTMLMDTFSRLGRGPINCAVFGRVGTDEVAMSIVKALGKRSKAALLAAHGAVCLGRDIDEAVQVAVILELVARQAIFASLLGTPPQLKAEDLVDHKTLEAHPEALEELEL